MEKRMLGIETGTVCRRMGDVEGLKLIAEAGFDCVDFSFFTKEQKKTMAEGNYQEHLEMIKQTLDGLGLCCNQAHAPMDFHYGQKMDLTEPDYAMLIKSIEGAAYLGAKYIVVHSLLTPAGVDLVDYNLDFYRSLLPWCEKFGIRIGFENLFDYDPYRRCMPRFADARSIMDFLNKMDTPWLVCCVDVGHAAIAGTDPEELIRGLDKDTLRLVHIHDTDYVDDRHMLPYMETQKWDEITSALAQIGYEGAFTFEVGKFFAKVPEGLLLSALRYAHDIGRYLIAQIDKTAE